MSRLRVHSFAISLDGYGAGPDQTIDHPLGVRGEELHEWIFETRFWSEMTGEPGGKEGVDHDFLVAGFTGIGAWIMPMTVAVPPFFSIANACSAAALSPIASIA